MRRLPGPLPPGLMTPVPRRPQVPDTLRLWVYMDTQCPAHRPLRHLRAARRHGALIGLAFALALPLCALCTLIPAAAAQAATPTGAASAIFRPSPGAVLTAGPSSVTVRLGTAPGHPAQVQLLNEQGDERAGATLFRRGDTLTVPVSAGKAGTYTILWTAGLRHGASTFTVWRGGALPPSLQDAAYGGPTAAPAGLWAAIFTALALAGGLAALGATAAARPGAARRSAGLLASAALLAALDHTALAADRGYPALLASRLFPLLLLRGVALDGLFAAALAVVAALLQARTRLVAAALQAAALAALLATVPAVRTGPFLGVWLTAVGMALWVGGAAGPGRRTPGWRWAGLGLAAATAATWLPWGHWPPAHADPLPLLGTGLALAAVALAVLPRTRPAAPALGLLALVAFGPTMAAPSALARGPLPQHTPWALTVRSGDETLRTSRLQPGATLLQVAAPLAHGAVLSLLLAHPGSPSVTSRLSATRLAPGLYGVDAMLPLPGAWRITAGRARFTLTLDGSAAGACRTFSGRAARWVNLGAPVRALAVDPGDPRVALAATAAAVFATSNAGRTWVPTHGPTGTVALTIGRYGQWWAATADGLQTSRTGGAVWRPASGLSGPAAAVTTPLYPAGVPVWSLIAGMLYQRTTQLTFTGLQGTWAPAGPAPAGTTALWSLPPPPAAFAQTSATPAAAALSPPLLATGSSGLWWLPGPGQGWRRLLRDPVSDVSAGPNALWATAANGLYTAPYPAGPWQRLPQVAAGVTQVAASGPAGQTLFLARPGSGLLESTDGGRRWTNAGCPVGTVTLMRGTYMSGRATGPTAPTLYLADADGDVVAVLPSTASGR